MNTSALALSNTPTQTKKPVGDTYLKFKFGQQTAAALLMNRAQEVVVLPVERLTPMPTMPLASHVGHRSSKNARLTRN